MLSADIKADVKLQEIKKLVVESYNFSQKYLLKTWNTIKSRHVFFIQSWYSIPSNLVLSDKNRGWGGFYLKLVSAIFYQIFILWPYDSPSKTMKNVFYFIEKALFVLKIFRFLYFCLPLFFPMSVIALEVEWR